VGTVEKTGRVAEQEQGDAIIMKKYLILTAILFLLYPNCISAYDDKTTHPDISEKAAEEASKKFNFNNYLIDNLGLKLGIDTNLQNHVKEKTLDEK
jgi:hypothetical protein